MLKRCKNKSVEKPAVTTPKNRFHVVKIDLYNSRTGAKSALPSLCFAFIFFGLSKTSC